MYSRITYIVAMCPDGYRTDVTDGCILCPVDTYANGSMCTPCKTGYSTNGLEGGVDESACSYSEYTLLLYIVSDICYYI